MPGGTITGTGFDMLAVTGGGGGSETVSGVEAEIRLVVVIPKGESCAYSVAVMDISIEEMMIKTRKITPNKR